MIFTVLTAFSSNVFAQETQKQIENAYKSEGFKLVFQDEFDIDGIPNSNYWTFEEDRTDSNGTIDEAINPLNGSIWKYANQSPFRNRYQYLLLNLALGGDNGGSLDDTPFPCRYLIDYVRIYQKTTYKRK